MTEQKRDKYPIIDAIVQEFNREMAGKTISEQIAQCYEVSSCQAEMAASALVVCNGLDDAASIISEIKPK